VELEFVELIGLRSPVSRGPDNDEALSTCPNEWAVTLEHPALNTMEFCQVCIDAESIARAEKERGVTGLGQSCSFQWKVYIKEYSPWILSEACL